MRFQKISIFLLIFLLASCVSSQAPSSSVQPAIPATRTATKFIPSQTPMLSLTETPTPTITPLVTVTPLKLTKEEINNALEQRDYEKFCNHYYRSWSPDNQWFMAGCKEPVVAQIINLHTGTIYSVDIRYYYPLYNSLQATIQDELWSSDGKYLFLRPHICCADGPASIVDGVALYRVDLTNGDVWVVLPPSDAQWIEYAFEFSPNEKYLAYISPFRTNLLHILDLATKQEVTKEFDKKFRLGGVVWTRNGKQIVLAGMVGDEVNNDYRSSLFLINSKDLSWETLIDNDAREFVPDRYPSAWIQRDTIRLFSFYDQSYWTFNIQTKSLSILPTPVP